VLAAPSQSASGAQVGALDGIAPSGLTWLLTQKLFDTPSWWRGAPTPDPDAAFSRLLERVDQLRGRERPSWDPELRGQYSWRYPGAEATYQTFLTAKLDPERMEADRARLQQRNDILELRIDEAMFRDFIEAVTQAKQVADHTFVVLMPRNHDWAEPTAAGRERLRTAVARIQRDTGVEVLDLTGGYASADFFDVGHLNEVTGVPRFARELADRIAARVPASPRTAAGR
jgi:hypothetical protein